jgi:BioD-like phosphotransacetylase family protein
MPWVENRLSRGREGKNEPKVRGGSRNDITLAAITMNKLEIIYIEVAAFIIVDQDLKEVFI